MRKELDLLEEFIDQGKTMVWMGVPLCEMSREELCALAAFQIDQARIRHDQYLADIRDVHNMYADTDYYDEDYDDYYDEDYYDSGNAWV